MLSVAFPRLPEDAFNALFRSSEIPSIFFFENEKKALAEAAVDFREKFFSCEISSFSTLENFLPKNRITLTLGGEDEHVPAPKIFVSGTFDEQARGFAAIPLWQISREKKGTVLCAHIFIREENAPDADTLCADYARLKKITENPAEQDAFPEITVTAEVGGDTYLKRSALAIDAIMSGKFEKIVLARAKDFFFSVSQPFPSQTLCNSLRKRFLSSGCTLFSARTDTRHPGERVVGASPEMLVRLENGKLETEALAGTIPNSDTAQTILEEQLLSDSKERREHSLVVDFIAEKLKNVGLKPQFCETPKILRLPNVLHLHTPISAEISTAVSIGEIVDALHPTPAMCGVPATTAKEFIGAHEPFPRENFSAPVGFLDANGNGFFAVAIRCAKIFDDKIRLYAGSGLVNGSLPEKEFSEIEAKISALASCLRIKA